MSKRGDDAWSGPKVIVHTTRASTKTGASLSSERGDANKPHEAFDAWVAQREDHATWLRLTAQSPGNGASK